MRFLLALILLLVPQTADRQRHQLDLEPLLHDPAALQKLKVLYMPPAEKGWVQQFFIFGDGSVVLQAFPTRPMARTEVPTCRDKISAERVREVVRVIVERHFFDLPERHFMFLSVAQSEEKLELHTIILDDGIGWASRTFGIGKFAGKEESLPPDFSAIEEELKRLKNSAFPVSEKTCHMAPVITF